MKLSIKLLSLFLIIGTSVYAADTASILPPAKTQFLDQNGKPLTSGTVDFYIPSTTTRKATWKDAGETILNTNPVVLDAAGRGLILGSGSYRQIVKDRLGNLIWDQVTASSSSGGGGSTPATGDGDLVGTVKPWAGMSPPNQYLFTYGQEISRTTFAALYTAITSKQSVFCNSGSPTLSGLNDTTNFWIGMPVEVSCVAAGFSTIISKTASTITLAANANVTTNTTAILYPWGRGDGATTFNLPDFRGVVPAGNNNMGGTVSANLNTTYFGATNPNSIGALGGSQSTVFLQSYLPNVNFTVAAGQSVGVATVSSDATILRSTTHDNYTSVAGDAGFVQNVTNGTVSSTGTGTVTNTGTAASGGFSTPFSRVQPTKTVNFIIKTTPDANSATASGVTSLGAMTGDIACGTGLLCTGNVISVNIVTTTDLVRVSNRGFLKALDPTIVKSAFLGESGGREGLFNWTVGDYSSAVSLDTNEGIYIRANSISTSLGAWVRSGINDTYQMGWFGAIADSATDNTALINSVIPLTIIPNLVSTPGRQPAIYINVNGGVWFNSTGLTFLPANGYVYVYLRYFANSNRTKGVNDGGGATNEQHTLSLNSGYPGDGTGAMVAEWNFDAPLHPSIILGAAGNISGADAHFKCSVPLVAGQCLGTGQTRIPTSLKPVNASFDIKDQNLARVNMQYSGYGDNSALTGYQISTIKSLVALVGTPGFTGTGWCGGACVPAIGDTLIGVTSGARAVLTQTAGVPTPDIFDNLIWISGTFASGETVSSNGNTVSGANIGGGGVVLTSSVNAPIWFGLNVATTTFGGIYPGNSLTQVNIGGRLTLSATSGGVGNIKETVTNASLLFTNTGNAIASTGRQIVLNSSNRLVTVKGITNGTGATADSWATGPTLAVSFTDAVSPTPNSSQYGVTSISRSSAGTYAITLNHTLFSANATCTTGRSSAVDFLEVTVTSTTVVTLISRNSGGGATNLNGTANIICFGGDS